MYSRQLMQHALHPRNHSPLGSASFERCGDWMNFQFRISEQRIEEVRAQSGGCGAARAAASVATELLRGRSVDEARNLSSLELHEALGGVPPAKRHALWMVLECVAEALGPRQGDATSPQP